MAPFLWMGFNCLKATAITRRYFIFTIQFPEIPGAHFIDLGRMKGWFGLEHPVVLNTGPLDWESSALSTRPLLL